MMQAKLHKKQMIGMKNHMIDVMFMSKFQENIYYNLLPPKSESIVFIYMRYTALRR